MAGNIQENVKKAIETMSGLTVSSVDVHVQGVSFEREQRSAAEIEQKQRLMLQKEQEEAKAEEAKAEAPKPEAPRAEPEAPKAEETAPAEEEDDEGEYELDLGDEPEDDEAGADKPEDSGDAEQAAPETADEAVK